jgi:hypothetical protein
MGNLAAVHVADRWPGGARPCRASDLCAEAYAVAAEARSRRFRWATRSANAREASCQPCSIASRESLADVLIYDPLYVTAIQETLPKMPDHKRQHYVPRCYLKPFSLDRAGAAINLYNIPRLQAARTAPVKGQCARDYLYGEDLRLERALQEIEGEYARILRAVEQGTQTQVDLAVLRGFAYLQYSRTDMAMRRRRMAMEGMHDAIFEGRQVRREEIDVSDRTMMRDSMKTYLETREYVEDLKVCIVKNETGVDFVTSDDPSVFTSRYYVQRRGDNKFGLSSSGALFFLPLTPRLLLLCYDGLVYTIPDKNGAYVIITDQDDVFALNELQYLKAVSNIYFSNWGDRERIAREFCDVSARRPTTWYEVTTWVLDHVEGDVERYRCATEDERQTAKHAMLSLSSLHPVPRGWLSKLKYRQPVRTYSNGSAVGHVRKRAWLRSRSDRAHRYRRAVSNVTGVAQ